MRSIVSPAVLLASLLAVSASARGGEDAVLEGSLMYPGCAAPADLRVCASALGGQRRICVQPTTTPSGLVYRMTVPSGAYHVFAETGARQGYRAYFSAAVTCGLDVACADHTPVVIEAVAGHAYSGVSPADWFAPDVTPAPTVLARR